MRICVQFMILLCTHQHEVVVWCAVIPCGITGPSSLLGSILRHPQRTFLPQCERSCVTPIQINRQNYSSVYLNPCIYDSNLEDKRFCTKWEQAFPGFILLIISSWIEFWLVWVVPKYFNCSTFAKELLSVFILWLRPAFWSRDMTMYLVLSAFLNQSHF
jgi:hypothetical protein